MLVLIGTAPYKTGLYAGKAKIHSGDLRVGGAEFSIERGTAAMAAACCQVCDFFGLEPPLCVIGGDIHDGKGTDLMFREVIANLQAYTPDLITLHYLFPKVVYAQPLIDKIKSLGSKPQLVADAGGMYLFKTVNQAGFFDVFTPDEGEAFFLADEFAPHPLYVRSELLKRNLSLDELIKQAFVNNNTAKTTIVKGKVDAIYEQGVRVRELAQPDVPAMEAIGGTGDTITGMLSALRFKGIKDADFHSLLLNRLIGQKIGCNAATQISEFILAIPKILEEYAKNLV
jgi:ADP-dependent NAD(P)H-hydrate dehydratase / NAD(P)H-hydrate epimerase